MISGYGLPAHGAFILLGLALVVFAIVATVRIVIALTRIERHLAMLADRPGRRTSLTRGCSPPRRIATVDPMALITRGFTGRRRDENPNLPPGQTLVGDWPVLSAGPTPQIDTEEWTLSVVAESGTSTWTWDELLALGVEDVTVDIHCVTHWSKLGMAWRGVPLDAIFENVETSRDFVMAHSYGGYTTNVPLDELLDGQAWIATEADGEPLDPEHGGPARLLVPHLYFWKSAKWVRALELIDDDEPGFWEQNGYHLHGDPWREERYS